MPEKLRLLVPVLFLVAAVGIMLTIKSLVF